MGSNNDSQEIVPQMPVNMSSNGDNLNITLDPQALMQSQYLMISRDANYANYLDVTVADEMGAPFFGVSTFTQAVQAPSNLNGASITITMENSGNTVSIQSGLPGVPLWIDSYATDGGTNTVDLGNNGSLSGIQGDIHVDTSASSNVNLNVDDSAPTSAPQASLNQVSAYGIPILR